VAADGIVFDMSSHESGPAFYGPGGGYHAFAGRDATIGLATMEVSPDKCTKVTVAELSAAERDTLGDWVQRFSMKYHVVGYLTDGAHPRSVAGQAAGGGGR
jgi:membrane-associated progesterone receptor component